MNRYLPDKTPVNMLAALKLKKLKFFILYFLEVFLEAYNTSWCAQSRSNPRKKSKNNSI
jgi:hypothetical protein